MSKIRKRWHEKVFSYGHLSREEAICKAARLRMPCRITHYTIDGNRQRWALLVEDANLLVV